LGAVRGEDRKDKEAELRRHEESLTRITGQFEKEHGPIIDSFFALGIGAAAALTGAKPEEDEYDQHFSRFPGFRFDPRFRSRLHIHRTYNMSDANADAVQLLMGCDVLYQRARMNLSHDDGDRVISMVFGIVKALLSLIDARDAALKSMDDQLGPSRETREKTMAMLRSELQRAEEQYDEAMEAQRKGAAAQYQLLGRRLYLLGMLPVALLILPVLGLLGYWALKSRLPIDQTEVGIGAAAFIAGAVGAAVSVMLRMTAGKLTVQPALEPAQIMALGSFRPVIGAIFALAFFLFIRGGLVPIAVPDDPTTQLFFFPAIGFIAGFSERFAQDTIKGAEASLSSANTPSP
jgi:hypothetical protein